MIDLSPEEQEKNKAYQQIRLMSYLNDMPIIQTMIDYVEADDVISYVAQHKKYTDWDKIIISSDKDFFQLINKKCTLYRPIQDTLLQHEDIIKTYGIHPKNFALARALVGDKSDNLKGINRVGLKTVRNKFPFMLNESRHEPEDIFKFCKEVQKPISVHTKILENKKLVEKNYTIMQLYSPAISKIHKQQINYALVEFDKSYNKIEIIKKLAADGIDSGKFAPLFASLKKITK